MKLHPSITALSSITVLHLWVVTQGLWQSPELDHEHHVPFILSRTTRGACSYHQALWIHTDTWAEKCHRAQQLIHTRVSVNHKCRWCEQCIDYVLSCVFFLLIQEVSQQLPTICWWLIHWSKCGPAWRAVLSLVAVLKAHCCACWTLQHLCYLYYYNHYNNSLLYISSYYCYNCCYYYKSPSDTSFAYFKGVENSDIDISNCKCLVVYLSVLIP